jgi:ATP-binding cassette subfamily B (MDR/TAP) protein 1
LATSGISRTSAIGADSTKANESAVSIFEILDRKSKIDSSSEEGVVIASVRGDIEFHNVCFNYPLRPNIQIFKDLSLCIPSGKVAFYLN